MTLNNREVKENTLEGLSTKSLHLIWLRLMNVQFQNRHDWLTCNSCNVILNPRRAWATSSVKHFPLQTKLTSAQARILTLYHECFLSHLKIHTHPSNYIQWACVSQRNEEEGCLLFWCSKTPELWIGVRSVAKEMHFKEKVEQCGCSLGFQSVLQLIPKVLDGAEVKALFSSVKSFLIILGKWFLYGPRWQIQ